MMISKFHLFFFPHQVMGSMLLIAAYVHLPYLLHSYTPQQQQQQQQVKMIGF